MSNLATTQSSSLASVSPEIAEALILQGDISRLSSAQKTEYAVALCQKLGLEPLTKPFQVIAFPAKDGQPPREQLYVTRNATDQLRRSHGISIRVTRDWVLDGLQYIEVEGTDRSGRKDTEIGFAVLSGERRDKTHYSLSGEARGNAYLRALTKAKRRLTLAMCGLSLLSPEEVEDIPGSVTAQVVYPELAPTETRKALPQLDAERQERIALASNVKDARIAAGWDQEDYIQYCETQFGKHPTQLNLVELQQALDLLSGLNNNTIKIETDQ